MKFKNMKLRRSDILGRRVDPQRDARVADIDQWRQSLGYLSMFAGMATLLAANAPDIYAKASEDKVPPRVSKRAQELVKKLNAACSKPELLRRQSDYRLPTQEKAFNMVELFAGADACPGAAIPAGSYTSGAPFTDTGNTTGANSTVTFVQDGCFEYYVTAGPDHIYSFTMTARGANPQIRVAPGNGSYDLSTYVLSSTGTACPAGVDNDVINCLTGADAVFNGFAETISAAEINTLPLNVPLYLFVDSFYSTAGTTPQPRHQGPYTVTVQDITVGGGPTPPSNDAPVDMNGDGKTDFVTVRNTGGGSGGQITWFTSFQDGFPTSTTEWGIASDQFVPADYDGDGKDDFAIFRPGATGGFYIVQSSNAVIRIERFGAAGDDASVVGDYNGDGEDDIAVYRSGATTGDQSSWFYRPRANTSFIQVDWGQGGDFPAPGDYDGDGKYDFMVQRDDSGGVAGRFWLKTSAGVVSSQFFGLKDDAVVPGDYDDDGKTDIAVARNDGGQIRWTFEPSGTAGVTEVTDVWGDAATDFITQGDYDGDGRTDYAVWRPGSPGTFYIMTVSRSISSRVWGLTGDYPVANYNQH